MKDSQDNEGKPLGKYLQKSYVIKNCHINIQKRKNPLKTQQYDNEQPVLKISKRLKQTPHKKEK